MADRSSPAVQPRVGIRAAEGWRAREAIDCTFVHTHGRRRGRPSAAGPRFPAGSHGGQPGRRAVAHLRAAAISPPTRWKRLWTVATRACRQMSVPWG